MKNYGSNDANESKGQKLTPDVQRGILVKDLEEEANIQLRHHIVVRQIA